MYVDIDCQLQKKRLNLPILLSWRSFASTFFLCARYTLRTHCQVESFVMSFYFGPSIPRALRCPTNDPVVSPSYENFHCALGIAYLFHPFNSYYGTFLSLHNVFRPWKWCCLTVAHCSIVYCTYAPFRYWKFGRKQGTCCRQELDM